MKIWHSLQALMIACCFSAGAFAQSAPPEDMDAYVARAMQSFNVPGIGIAIVKDGKVVLAKGYGVRRLGSPEKVDANTLFGIASNTKAFTAAALGILVDEHKVDWDAPVTSYLPWFQMYDPYVTHEMTVRDLLTHRSGLGLGAGDLMFAPHSTFTSEEIIYRMRYIKPVSSFRSRFAYDNLLYVAGGLIIQAVTGKTWSNFIREGIFAPLGMNRSLTSITLVKPGDDAATPHAQIDGELQPIRADIFDNVAPAGAVISCVADLTKWLQVQLGHGKLPDSEQRLFSEKESREMWSAQTIIPMDDPPAPLADIKPNFSAYGLGWTLSDYHGRKLAAHNGGLTGMFSRTALIPEENLGVVVLTNAQESGALNAIVQHVLDHYLAVQSADWITAYLKVRDLRTNDAAEVIKKQEGMRDASSKPSLELGKYAGHYNDAWYGTATINFENGNLVLRFDHSPSMVGDFQHWQYDTFVVHWRDHAVPDAFVTFVLKPDGTIEQFKMKAISPLADFSYDYQDLLFTPLNHPSGPD